MRKWLKWGFAVDAVIGAILGLLLLIIPGRFLGLFGWAPIDPLISRILGAAVLALTWASATGWWLMRSGEGLLTREEWLKVRFRLEMATIFGVLACVGVLRHLLSSSWPWYVWTLFVLLAALVITGIIGLLMRERPPDVGDAA